MQNSTVTIPTAVVFDNLDEVVKYAVDVTYNGVSVNVQNSTFVADALGYYTCTYTATDAANNQAVETVVYKAVATQAETYQVWCFDESIDYMDNFAGMTVEYNTDPKYIYGNEKGSTKMYLNDLEGSPVFSYKNQLIDTSGFREIYFYVYNDSNVEVTLCPNVANNSPCKPGQWSKVTITMAQIGNGTNPMAPTASKADLTGVVNMFYKSSANPDGLTTIPLYFSSAYGVK